MACVIKPWQSTLVAMQPSVKRAWPIMAALVVCCRAGTDGAMSLFYEQQLTLGSLDSWPHKEPIGIDAMGKLVPAVLKVGHLVHRDKEATAQYAEIHRWVKWLLSFGVSLIFVFDGLARYPPKAARAHKERAEREKQDRADAVQLDADGEVEKANKLWIRVLDRATLLCACVCLSSHEP